MTEMILPWRSITTVLERLENDSFLLLDWLTFLDSLTDSTTSLVEEPEARTISEETLPLATSAVPLTADSRAFPLLEEDFCTVVELPLDDESCFDLETDDEEEDFTTVVKACFFVSAILVDVEAISLLVFVVAAFDFPLEAESFFVIVIAGSERCGELSCVN